MFEKLGLNGISEYINSLDIACLSETFTFSSFDFNIKFGDFIHLHSPAKKFNIRGRPSGGLVILIRKTLERYISIIDTKISQILCFKISKDYLNTDKDILCIGTYVHPSDSVFYTDEDHNCTLEAVEQFLLDQLEEGEEYEYLLMGDLNARIGDWGLKVNNEEDEEEEEQGEEEILERRVQDGVINENGHKLIQICLAFMVTPLSGLVKKKFDGNFTFIGRRGNSIIDHFVCSLGLINRIQSYKTCSRIESQHQPIEMELYEGEEEERREEEVREAIEVRKVKWSEAKRGECNNILNKPGTLREIQLASELLDNNNLEQGLDKFDNVMNKLNKPLTSTFKTGQVKEDKKKWFDKECEQMKKDARKALINMNKINPRKKKEEHKVAKDLYLDKRIEYQKLIREKRKKYKMEMQEKLVETRNDAKKILERNKEINLQEIKTSKHKQTTMG